MDQIRGEQDGVEWCEDGNGTNGMKWSRLYRGDTEEMLAKTPLCVSNRSEFIELSRVLQSSRMKSNPLEKRNC